MSGIGCAIAGAGGTNGLDTQTVTVGGAGTAGGQDRIRGWQSGVIGSIADGTSNIFGGGAIGNLSWKENFGSPVYQLQITGSTNTGWTSLYIGSTQLLRISASFASNTWTWTTTDTIANQAFGSISSIVSCVFM